MGSSFNAVKSERIAKVSCITFMPMLSANCCARQAQERTLSEPR
jgi:hypothetical protein